MRKVMGIVLALAMLIMTGCSQQAPVKEVDLGAVMASLATQHGVEEEVLELTEDDLMEFYGIQSADVKQFAARMMLDSLQADEIVLIEAKDSAAAGRVKEKLEARYQAKLNETRDYLPDEFAKIEKCRVTAIGNHVALIICADGEAAAKEYEAALK